MLNAERLTLKALMPCFEQNINSVLRSALSIQHSALSIIFAPWKKWYLIFNNKHGIYQPEKPCTGWKKRR